MAETKKKTLQEFNQDLFTYLFGDAKTISNPLDGKVPDFVLGDPLGLFSITPRSTKVAISKRNKK